MGGAKSGNIASTLAADVFVQQIKQSWSGEYIQGNVDKMMKDAIKVTNFTVFDQSQQFEEFTGMGTTLVAVLTNGKWATIVNVGDSRAYLIDRAGIHQVTVDHSVVQLMVSRGELTPEQAKTYPGKSLITRAIGTETLVHCDIFHKKVTKGDYLLLCSDGLSNLMDDQEILFEVAHGQDKEKCCQRLLDIAKKRGAPDNVTSILLSI
jgi:protein phosphatase